MKNPFSLLGLALLAAALMARAADLSPVAVRTEYLDQPLGLDVARPRLSWELQTAPASPRGAAQTAFHILVATQPALLRPGAADLWDSGEVAGSSTAHVAYAGRPLAAGQACHWAVRVRDQVGAWSVWSAPARWTMGPLRNEDWTAKWIGTGENYKPAKPAAGKPPESNTIPDPWFRRAVKLAAVPARATAYVATVGYHELFINGRKVGDAVLMPSVTDNTKRARYVTYDLTGLLQAGENVVGLWLGTGWSIYSKFETADKPRAPIVLAQIDLEDADGRVQRIATDESWKTHPSPNTLVGKWDFMDFGGEHYDASREIAGWAAPGLDDSAWKPAVVFSPKLAVSADRVEPNRRLTELAATAVTEPESGVYRVDFGRNVAGMFEFAIAGQPGDRIEFQFSERENQPVTHRLRSSYVIGPSGRGTFQHRFNYATARWVTIRGLRQAPAARDCRAWLVRSSFADATAFECSNPLLNDIAATTRWTLENLALGGYIVDCPQRERMGYGGDGHATTTTALNLFRTGAFFTKWAEDWRDVQGRGASWGVGVPAGQAGSGSAAEEGNLPYTAPTYWGGGGPAWSGYCIHLPWEVYRHYGDTRILGENFAMIERWLAFLETKSRDDLLRRWGGQWDFLGDWLWPGAPPNPVPPNSNGDRRDTLCLNNCYWIYNLTTAARIADVLGRTDEAAAWRQRADTVRRAVHREFFNAGDASYDNGFQAVLAQALLNELPPTDARPAVWRRLEREILVVRGGHIHAGITGGAFLFKLLMEARRDDLIHTMVNQREYPGWGFMLAKGATTIWEIWEDEARHSRLHSSYLYVGAWFIHGVLGLQPDPAAPGFARFAIRPAPLDRPDLTWARGHHDTVHGRIAVEWRRADGQFTLNATVPPGTTALAHLPATSAAVITEAGQPLAMVKGTRFLRVEDDRAVVELGSGSYNFAMPVAR